MASLYQRILGIPFVFERIRPMVVGGIDMSPAYDRLGATADDVLVDIGCGTGDALNYLTSFAQYAGYDVDEHAIDAARRRSAGRANVAWYARTCGRDDIERHDPTLLAMVGLLHHLSDDEAVTLLSSTQTAARLRRIVTLDIVLLEGEPLNNFFARLDRGRFCRKPEAYEALVARAGLALVETAIVRSHPTRGRVKYIVMVLAPRNE